MQLNHLNLCVSNLADAITFFETFFGFRCLKIKGRDTLAVLEGQGGVTLVLSHSNDVTPVYPDGFHIGFILDTAEQVQQSYTQLTEAGREVPHAPKSMHGSLAFYCLAPGSILVEVSCPL